MNEQVLADINTNLGELNGKFGMFLESAREQTSLIHNIDRRVQKLESFVEITRDREKRKPVASFMSALCGLLKGLIVR
jgi:hypothetical protein